MVGVFWGVFISSSGWEILVGMISPDDWWLGLLQATMHVAVAFMILGAILIERTGLTKYQFLVFGTIHRVLWLLVAAVPLVVPVPSNLAMLIILALILASWCAEAVCRPAWFTWMGALIPPRIRGRYWGRRTQFITITQTIAGLGLGYLVSQLQSGVTNPSAADHPHLLHGLMILLAIGSILGIVDILMFRRIPEVLAPTTTFDRSAHTPGRRTIWIMLHWILVQPLRDSEFRRFVLCDMLMTFAMGCTGMYVLRTMRLSLGLDAFDIGLLFFLVSPVTTVMVARPFGRALDRLGPRKVMTVAAFATVLGILPFMFAWPGMPRLWLWALLVFTFICGSAAWGAFMMGRANVQLRFADREGASRYVTAFNFYISVGGMAGGLLAALLTWVLAFMRPHPIRLGPIVWNNWHMVFLVSMLARIAGACVLRGGRGQKAD